MADERHEAGGLRASEHDVTATFDPRVRVDDQFVSGDADDEARGDPGDCEEQDDRYARFETARGKWPPRAHRDHRAAEIADPSVRTLVARILDGTRITRITSGTRITRILT